VLYTLQGQLPFALEGLASSPGAVWRPRPGRFHFLLVDFAETAGKELSQSTKSLCKTIVDLPCFFARSSPRLIAS
jgi:hypothetical protein